MSGPMIILACVASYMAGGVAGMAVALILQSGRRADACERKEKPTGLRHAV